MSPAYIQGEEITQSTKIIVWGSLGNIFEAAYYITCALMVSCLYLYPWTFPLSFRLIYSLLVGHPS